MKKNILWIEDFDIKSTNIRSKRSKNKSTDDKPLEIFDKKYRDVIEIKKSMLDGIEYIIKHKGEFDCVILDVNMSKNLQFDKNENTYAGKIWGEFLKHVNLEIDEEQEGNKIDYKIDNKSAVSVIGENAGFYLVLFLISLGFPKERIIMFTAYGGDNPDSLVSKWKEKFKETSLFIPCIVDKDETFNKGCKNKNKKLNESLDKLYSQEYYKTRLFLYIVYNTIVSYKASISIEDYKEKINKTIFNYVCKDTDKKIRINQVEDLMENVLFYFPYMENGFVKDVNYQALKRFSEPFEADYNVNKVEKFNTYRVMKLYRNWSAHSLFLNPENLSDEMFRLLLVVGLLLMIEPKCDNSNNQIEQNKLDIEELSQKWKNNLWKKIEFLFQIEVDKEIQEILEHIEKYDWEMCKVWNEIPKNMLDVYDKHGKKGKKQMEFYYLLDAFMNCFILNGIQYEGNTCKTNYELSEQTKDIYLYLFKSAYSIFVTMKDKKKEIECINSND